MTKSYTINKCLDNKGIELRAHICIENMTTLWSMAIEDRTASSNQTPYVPVESWETYLFGVWWYRESVKTNVQTARTHNVYLLCKAQPEKTGPIRRTGDITGLIINILNWYKIARWLFFAISQQQSFSVFSFESQFVE